MKITVVTGTGEATTQLAAFDMALWRGGIANYNLVVLSSVIPRFATVAIEPHKPCEDEWGHRLYVVLAQRGEVVSGSEAWAGLGWVQDDSGAGLFVEHNGPTRHQVESQIDQSLTSMTAYRNRHFGKIEMVTVGIECRDQPVAAIVAAVYEVQPWRENGTIGALRMTRG